MLLQITFLRIKYNLQNKKNGKKNRFFYFYTFPHLFSVWLGIIERQVDSPICFRIRSVDVSLGHVTSGRLHCTHKRRGVQKASNERIIMRIFLVYWTLREGLGDAVHIQGVRVLRAFTSA